MQTAHPSSSADKIVKKKITLNKINAFLSVEPVLP